jgi:hypothetical protein
MITFSPHIANRPAFSSHIKFCTKEEFDSHYLQDETVKVGEVDYGRNIGTNGILMCNAGGITGGKKITDQNMVFHISDVPFFFGDEDGKDVSQNLREFSETIKNATNELREKGIKPQGLIVGGDEAVDGSKYLFVVLSSFFKKKENNVDYSVFFGAEEQKDIFYDGNKDEWLIHMADDAGNDITRKKDVCNAFSYIKMSPNDDVCFPDSPKEYKNINKGNLGLTFKDVLDIYEVPSKTRKELGIPTH